MLFRSLSPLGKVPLLLVGEDTVLFESAPINEYLDEVTGSPRLQAEDPLTKARDRAWIEFTSALLGEHWRMYASADQAAALSAREALVRRLQILERDFGDGPLWRGSVMSLVDAAAAPLLQRIVWTDQIAPAHAMLDDLPKVAAWAKALLGRRSVQRSTVPDIRERFAAYVRRPRADGPPGWLGSLEGP